VIKLRGHHLICLHFYRSEGYSREFVKNLEDIVRRATEGEKLEVVVRRGRVLPGLPDVARRRVRRQGRGGRRNQGNANQYLPSPATTINKFLPFLGWAVSVGLKTELSPVLIA
jgi:hypothetical protein